MKRIMTIAGALLLSLAGLSACSNDDSAQSDSTALKADLAARKAATAKAVIHFREAFNKAISQRSALPKDKDIPLFNDTNKSMMIEEAKALLTASGHEQDLGGDDLTTIAKAFDVYASETQITFND